MGRITFFEIELVCSCTGIKFGTTLSENVFFDTNEPSSTVVFEDSKTDILACDLLEAKTLTFKNMINPSILPETIYSFGLFIGHHFRETGLRSGKKNTLKLIS